MQDQAPTCYVQCGRGGYHVHGPADNEFGFSLWDQDGSEDPGGVQAESWSLIQAGSMPPEVLSALQAILVREGLSL